MQMSRYLDRHRWILARRSLMLVSLTVGLSLALIVVLGYGSANLSATRAQRSRATHPVSNPLQGPVAAGYYGINAGLAFSSADPASWATSASEIAQLGVGTVRMDAFWSAVEPLAPTNGRHVYRWQSTDQMVEALAASRLRWYPIIDYATNWAGVNGWESPPRAAYVPDYAAFAGALARRYGRRGSFWRAHPQLPAMPVTNYEIWNEPDFTHFWPDQSYAPHRLGEMYLDAQTQIRKADPAAQVVLGGLVAEGVEGFLTRMLQAEPALSARMQAVGFHPYGGGPNGGLQVTYARIRELRATLDRLFAPRLVPIEVTEIGWAVPASPETWRSERLRGLAVELPRSDCDVTRLIVYAWTSPDSGPSLETGFGIAAIDGSLTESALAFKAGILSTRTSGLAPTGAASIC
jgi:hypothetical protein